MNEDPREPGSLPRPDLPPYPLTEVNDSRPDDKPPTEVSKAVLSRIEGESTGVIRVDGVSDEATSCMCV